MSDQPDSTARNIQAYVDKRWAESILPALKEYIRIPNKSPAFDPDWESAGHMQTAVELLSEWAATSPLEGFRQEIITLPGRTPVLFAEIDASDGASHNEPTVLLYGHYDKQPEFDGWEDGLGPWIPVERDGKLYGRGGADDGYALFGSLAAIEALQEQGIAHPRCVILIEGCEESGSFDLPVYVEHLRERIGNTRLVVCLDAECGNYDQLWVTTSLRGMLPGVLKVDILTEGQHSGAAGGIVPSSFRIARHLLERVENSATGELHHSLYGDVPRHIKLAAQEVADVIGNEIYERFPWVPGGRAEDDELDDLVVRNTWHPSLATVGADGIPGIADAGNTLRPGTALKLVFRLPPNVDADEAAANIKATLEDEPPTGAQVTFEVETPQTGWSAPEEEPWLATALQEASFNYFGEPVMHAGIGGTIPFMKMLGDAYPKTQFFVTGVLGPKSNAHGPNEFLHIDTGRRLTSCVADVLAAAAREYAQER